MTTRKLFLSYKRGPVLTPVVKRLHDRCRVQLKASGIETFYDQRSIDAGEPWAQAIDAFLADAEFFLAFISIDFWLSDQCRREMGLAMARYEAGRQRGLVKPPPRPLWVLADRLDPNDLSLDDVRAGELLEAAAAAADAELAQRSGNAADGAIAAAPVAALRSVGDINFLGPYDDGGRLVRLAFEDPPKLDDQLAALVERIRQLAR